MLNEYVMDGWRKETMYMFTYLCLYKEMLKVMNLHQSELFPFWLFFGIN